MRRCVLGALLLGVGSCGIAVRTPVDDEPEPDALGNGGQVDTGGTGATGGGASGGDFGAGGASSLGSGGTGGVPAAGGSANLPDYTASILVEFGPPVSQEDAGMAVAHDDKLYLLALGPESQRAIHAFNGTSFDVFVTEADVAAAGAEDPPMYDIDADNQGNLYALTASAIFLVDEAGNVELEHEFDPSIWVPGGSFAALSPGEFLVVSNDGLVYVKGDEVTVTDFTVGNVSFSTMCATTSIVAHASGDFMYQEGCTGSQLMTGSLADLSPDGVSVLPPDGLDAPESIGIAEYIGTFMCLAKRPGGGFISVLDLLFSRTTQLFLHDHLPSNSTQWQPLGIEPSLDALQAEAELDDVHFALSFCSVAEAPGGTIYLYSMERLWALEPVP